MKHPTMALLNLGGGEIILILFILMILLAGALLLAGMIYLIVWAATKPAARLPAVSGAPPSMNPTQPARDREHLRVLAVFHFVLAGMLFIGIAFLFVHHQIMGAFFENPEFWKNQNNPGPPPEFFHAFIWLYVFLGFILVAATSLNILSGLCLYYRKYRMFSMAVGGLNCLQFPFGTALGVFTILVLMRDSVRAVYEGQSTATL
jgi:hypothetical protein